MYDPSMRVLTVLELLQAREEVSGAELARRLEVSPRTVQRYVARLQDLGIPVEGRRGVGGAYRLRPGFQLPPLMFTGEEALALALGLRALTHLGLHALAPAAQGAGAKLARTLPHALRADVQALELSVQLDASPWVVGTDAALLADLLRAVRGACAVEFTYTARSERATTRRADIYRVVHVDGRWYAVGWCHLRAALRSFRLDRMQDVAVLDETFTPPPDFDAVAYLREAMPEPAAHEVSVWLEAPPEALRGAVSGWHTDLTPEAGGTRLRTRRDNLRSFAAFLLGLECSVRVDGPPALLQEFADLQNRCVAIQSGQAAESYSWSL
ncbi:putative DNA-binding transcriptional regulator YafY [Deinococcus metalli]|uniref:Putative DNA-binding transcriptional regulator YafY n=1 Tax=Deinococcus metalli TaxID=1141878 RepID=A0A7W8NPP2_9DEIO|nr:YafY family protein [Deinococcus metalli]MBB5375980.1 putative DNA-binding transcriptional regulator YafY [Deinococcus metalli]GHF41707.1 repressor [Deinococcus metalli]